jgi:hypothetical protein
MDGNLMPWAQFGALGLVAGTVMLAYRSLVERLLGVVKDNTTAMVEVSGAVRANTEAMGRLTWMVDRLRDIVDDLDDRVMTLEGQGGQGSRRREVR